MKRDEALSRLKEFEDRFKRAGITHLYLFGSTVRDEARQESDVDLFFDHEHGALSLFDIMHIKEMTADILGAKTDIIPRRGLHQTLRPRIEATAIQVF
jgi:predicted nucleotidyltransferase